MNDKRRILVVDDDRFHRKALIRLLEPDYQVVAVDNGPQALEVAHGRPAPDLILLDVLMPDVSGYQLCRQLKQDDATREIPVIFITAKDDSDDETKGLDLGAVDYIGKPFHPAIVRARIRTHLRLKEKIELLERLSAIDGLTNLPNRRAFDETLASEWTRMERVAAPLSVLMVDVDFFKRYNDRFGHPAGDECLRRVAAALATQAKRPADFAARYGGEEFALILPQTDAAGARAIGEQLCSTVASLAIPHPASDAAPVVTASIGVASTVPNREPTASALVEAADDALYLAKSAGRNRVAESAPHG